MRDEQNREIDAKSVKRDLTPAELKHVAGGVKKKIY